MKNDYRAAELPNEYGEIVSAYTWNLENCGAVVLDREASGKMPNQMSEGLSDNYLIKRYAELKKVMSWSFLLVIGDRGEQCVTVFYSDTKKVRALEFMDFLMSEFGLVKGDASCACGFISSVILKTQTVGLDCDGFVDCADYFLERMKDYFISTAIVDASCYADSERAVIDRMSLYRKKNIPWAYVRTLDVAAEGEKLIIKSLENESGIVITAADDVYIMIGVRGEVYDISRERFEATYISSDEPLDIFDGLIDFLPAMERVGTGEYISLDETARLCYPEPSPKIRAVRLSSRTKVYPCGGNGEYYLGRQGDYMAVRTDDYSDIYIVQQDIFEQTYEKV